MAIKSKHQRSEPSPQLGNVHGQPPAFYATGKPGPVNYPIFPARPGNANGSLTQKGSTPSMAKHLQKLYLFVDGIKTSWQLAGTFAQTEKSRTFYPKSFSQSALVITGSMANQYEFDLLVEFVQNHHHTIGSVDDEILGDGTGLNPVQVNSATFMLFHPLGGHTYRHIPKTNVGKGTGEHEPVGLDAVGNPFSENKRTGYMAELAILNIEAGHERFVYAPAFTLTCQVLNDYMQDGSDLEKNISDLADPDQVWNIQEPWSYEDPTDGDLPQHWQGGFSKPQ